MYPHSNNFDSNVKVYGEPGSTCCLGCAYFWKAGNKLFKIEQIHSGGRTNMNKVAVENTLDHVKQALTENGFEVVDLDTTQKTYVPDVMCYVISGQDHNVMGMADKQADLPVVNVEGLTANEALKEIQQRVKIYASAKS
jgi:hypothetical protein